MDDASIVHEVSPPGGTLDLRGRRAETEAVAALVASAGAGAGGCLVLLGEAGLGVTAMLGTAHRTAARAGYTVLSAKGSAREAALPFAALHQLIGPLADDVARLRPRLSARLGDALAHGRVGTDRLELCLAVLELLRTCAAERPVVCCVDDAQWLDRLSLDVLAFTAARVGTEPVALLVGGHDPGLLPDLPRRWLRPLDAAASRDVLADHAPAPLAGDVAGALIVTGAGNPGALVELARGLSVRACRGDAPPPTSLPVESVLRRTYLDRLDRLPDDARWLVLIAAADRFIEGDELVRAATASGTDIDALAPAERDGILRVGAHTRVSFPEPLLRAVAYEAAPLAQRRAAHTLLARVLEHPLRRALHRAATATEADPDLADALERACADADRTAAALAMERAADLSVDPVLAANRLVAAARHAWDGGEPHRARALLRRLRADTLPPPVRARIQLLLGEIELRAGASSHAGPALLAAADDLDHDLRVGAMMQAGEAMCLSGEYGHFADVARHALGLRRSDEPVATELMFDQFAGLTAMYQGDYARGGPALRRVLALAHELDDPAALIRAGMAAIVLGDDRQAYRLAVRAAGAARSTGNLVAVPQALEIAAAAECALGRYDEAGDTIERALPLARETGQDGLCSTLLGLHAVLAATVGDRDACLARVAQARSQLRTHGVSRAEALLEWAQGVLDLVEGRPADAAVRLAGLMGPAIGQGQIVIGIAATPHLVEAAVRSGEPALARPAQTMFDLWARSTDNPSWLALAARCRALLADDEADTHRHFTQALRHHHDAESDFERARTELLYGQELRRQRRAGTARDHLRVAAEVFERFRATPLVRQARAELRAAGEPVDKACGTAVDVLTAQQLEIARLAAEGATNREVAAALFLSTRTVDHHMRNIFTRLGIRSRVDLARLLT